MKANIKLTLGRLTPLGIKALLGFVAKGMTDNPHFPNPLVPLAEMRVLQKALESSIAEANSGGRQARMVRDGYVQEAKAMLNKQADYVRGIAAGDGIILVSSGFELQRERQRFDIPGPPHHLMSRSIAPNTVDLRWNRVPGAIAYMVQRYIGTSMEDPGAWETIGVTMKARIRMKGLERLKESWYRVSSLGTAGQGAYGAPRAAYAA